MKTYLVALDSSTVAEDVFDAATELAAQTGARLLLVQAVGIPVEMPHEALLMSPDNVVGLLQKNAQRELDGWLKRLPAGLTAEAIVDVGTPWQVICEVAKARAVDLVIIGAHGHKLLDRVLGTSTSRVVAHADRSTYIVWPRPHTVAAAKSRS